MENKSKIQNLKNYLIKIIDEFREEYDKLDDLERKQIAPNTIYSVPSQIEIFWVTDPSEFQLFVLLHNPHRPDKEIVVNGPFDLNRIADKVIEIMDEPRWKEKSPITEDSWFISPDAGDKEHKYSDEFAGHFSGFLNIIRQTSSQSFPTGLVTSQSMGENDFCSIFKGNVANLPSSELNQKSFIESAKQYAASIKSGSIPETLAPIPAKKEENRRKFFGSYYNPGARIGNNVELTFKEKVFGPDIFGYPRYEYGFAFNGRMGFFDRYGLVLIESDDEVDAIKNLNTIFGMSIVCGIDAFSIRKSDILSSDPPVEFVPLGKPLGSYSRRVSEITGYAPNLLGGMKKTQITLEKMEQIIKISERIARDEKLNESLLFLLESNTHLKNSEFSQAYIFCWLIVEQNISKMFKKFLSGEQETLTKNRNVKDPNKMPISQKMKILHSNKKINDQNYLLLTEYNKKRNDFVHSVKTITELDAKNLFKFAFMIIQAEIRDMIK
jgi:hypothetical protein